MFSAYDNLLLVVLSTARTILVLPSALDVLSVAAVLLSTNTCHEFIKLYNEVPGNLCCSRGGGLLISTHTFSPITKAEEENGLCITILQS